MIDSDIDVAPEFNPASQSMPAKRWPKQCGSEINLLAGREPTQLGWYDFAESRIDGKLNFLDVGCGNGKGLDTLARRGRFALGIEVDRRLAGIHPRSIIAEAREIPPGYADVVTAIDVIEHVVEDLVFLKHLRRIARRLVVITTPNRSQTGCTHPYHCREFTLAEFATRLRPDEVWSGSHDGWTGRQLVLAREGDAWRMDPLGKNELVEDQRLEADAEMNAEGPGSSAWPQLCGVFKSTTNHGQTLS